MLLHQDAVAISPVVVSEIADRQVSTQPVERLSPGVLILDHQGHIRIAKVILDAGEQYRCDPEAAEIGIDADIEHASLATVGVPDGAADDTFSRAGDDNVRSRPEIENEKRDEPVSLAAGKAAALKPLKQDRITKQRRTELDSGIAAFSYGSRVE